MGVPISEVGYTPSMPRREDHEVHKGHEVALDQKKKYLLYLHEPKGGGGLYCDMAVGCFTDVTVHSSKNYRHEHDTYTLATSKPVVAAWGAVILNFHGVANLRK